MNSIQRIRLRDERLVVRFMAVAVSASAAAACMICHGCCSNGCQSVTNSNEILHHRICRQNSAWLRRESFTNCEEFKKDVSLSRKKQVLPPSATQAPSWIRRILALLHLKALSIPRLIVKGDPAFHMDQRLLEKRQSDEMKMQDLVRGALQERDPKKLQALNDQCLELAYGEGMTLTKRQDFVHRHGCTAWTAEVLDAILELGMDRGIVEIGAGNGQWARALMERYQATVGEYPRPRKKFDFVLAYDDQSQLPLDQQVFNKRTKIHNQFFYDKVQPCDSNDFPLQKWENRGRVLLLVYPPPGKMAHTAVQQYTSASPLNDTVIYVGEGRGGANADGALFEYLEDGNWILLKVLNVEPLGSKGYEKLYILQRKLTDSK